MEKIKFQNDSEKLFWSSFVCKSLCHFLSQPIGEIYDKQEVLKNAFINISTFADILVIERRKREEAP